MIRPVKISPQLLQAQTVTAARGGEMETGSSHRELSEEPWQETSPAPEAPDSPKSGEAPGRSEIKPPGPARHYSELPATLGLRRTNPSPRPIALDRYKKAKKTGARERKLKKGGVIDEAS